MPSAARLRSALRPLVHRLRAKKDRTLHGGCAVLLYHRVADLITDPQQLAVSPSNFDAHLDLLKRKYKVLRVTEFDDHLLNGKRFPKNSVLLTFDDGYEDNHTIARPLLEKHGVEALFYIANGYIGSGREFWWDELERIFCLNPTLPDTFVFKKEDFHLSWSTLQERSAVYDRLLTELRKLSSTERDVILAELRVALHSTEARATHLPMTQAQLKEFARSRSVVIGAHSIGHCSLGYRTKSEQQAEIAGSQHALSTMLGQEIPYFSYPFGTGADFNAASIELARSNGYLHTAANYPGLAHKGSVRHAFPRFLVRDWHTDEFDREVHSFLNP